MVEKRLMGSFTPFARAMFHGKAWRPGAEYPLLEHRPGDDPLYCLSVTKNVFAEAPVFQPNLAWIIASRIRARLEGVPFIEFLQVRFEKLFSAPYAPEYNPLPGAEDDSEYFDLFANEVALIDGYGEWFEVIVPMLRVSSSDGVEVAVSRELSSKPLVFRVSPQVLSETPVFWFKELFLRGDVFERLSPLLNRRYFATTRVL